MSQEPTKPGETNRIESSRPPHLRESTGDHSASKGQQASKRFVYSTWAGGRDRELCEYAQATLPERAPFAGRTGLAVAKWTVVASRDDRALICNRLHDGDCAWPWDVQAG